MLTLWTFFGAKCSFIESLKINQASMEVVNVTAMTNSPTPVHFTVKDPSGTIVSTVTIPSGVSVSMNIPNAQTWGPDTPTLYTLEVSISGGGDVVTSCVATLRRPSTSLVLRGFFRANPSIRCLGRQWTCGLPMIKWL
jgi:hypothetical protein